MQPFSRVSNMFVTREKYAWGKNIFQNPLADSELSTELTDTSDFLLRL